LIGAGPSLTISTGVLNSSVLVLNRSYLPIHVTSVRRAFSLVYQDVARVVNEEYEVFDFEGWTREAPRNCVDSVGTPGGRIRVPRVILLLAFDRVPRRHVRYSRVNVFARDKFTCQYCGARPHRSQLNLDHVVPRSLGGRTTWENVVCSCVVCNRIKGGRTPEQARLRLQRRPERPRWTPLVNLAVAGSRYDEWSPFLRIVDSPQRPRATASAG
jgi:5-methylcytosine-specific restriction endonuclease McrA